MEVELICNKTHSSHLCHWGMVSNVRIYVPNNPVKVQNISITPSAPLQPMAFKQLQTGTPRQLLFPLNSESLLRTFFLLGMLLSLPLEILPT